MLADMNPVDASCRHLNTIT